MTYSAVSLFAQTWGLVLLVVLFAVALIYALWPANKERFSKAARLPLDEDDHLTSSPQSDAKSERPTP